MGGGLGHPFFVWEILRVEGLAPWPTALGIDRDRRVHAADLYPQLGRHCVDQPRFTAGQQEMRAWLGLHVDPGMEMQEMGVDRWGHGAGVGVDAQRSEEHTSELQSLMRISYAVFCLKKKKTKVTSPAACKHNSTT